MPRLPHYASPGPFSRVSSSPVPPLAPPPRPPDPSLGPSFSLPARILPISPYNSFTPVHHDAAIRNPFDFNEFRIQPFRPFLADNSGFKSEIRPRLGRRISVIRAISPGRFSW